MIDGDFDFNPDANHAKSVQRVLQPLLFRGALGGCKRSGIGILKGKTVPRKVGVPNDSTRTSERTSPSTEAKNVDQPLASIATVGFDGWWERSLGSGELCGLVRGE